MRKHGSIMLESGVLDIDVHDVEGNVAVVYDRFGAVHRVDVADIEDAE